MSSQLMQIITDITGCPQSMPQQKLGACYGDAFLAAVGSGYFHSTKEIGRWVSMERETTPDKRFKSVYDEGYERYRELYRATRHLL